jgi:hypothetical protein
MLNKAQPPHLLLMASNDQNTKFATIAPTPPSDIVVCPRLYNNQHSRPRITPEAPESAPAPAVSAIRVAPAQPLQWHVELGTQIARSPRTTQLSERRGDDPPARGVSGPAPAVCPPPLSGRPQRHILWCFCELGFSKVPGIWGGGNSKSQWSER